jgi:hypothetical protein
MSNITSKKATQGAFVSKNEVIGRVGNIGPSGTVPHLHFAVYYANSANRLISVNRTNFIVRPACVSPATPSLNSPSNQQTNMSTSSVNFTWSSITSPNPEYRIQISKVNSWTAANGFSSSPDCNSNIVVNRNVGSSTNFVWSSLLTGDVCLLPQPNTTYYWTVRAHACGISTSYSPVRSFTTAGSIAIPPVPTLIAPANGATNIPLTPTLSWNASSGATSYRLQISTNSSFTTMVYDLSNLTATSQPLNDFTSNTLYYWRVRASNTAGTSAWSSVRNFRTLTQIAIPPTPTLVTPANGATNIPLSTTLSWNASSGATSYHLQVSTNSSFTTTVYNQANLTNTSQPLSGFTSNTLYYWRVRASNTAGTSAWSIVRSFRTRIQLKDNDGSSDNNLLAKILREHETSMDLVNNTESGEEKQSIITLWNVYPVPFKESTFINLTLSTEAHIRLSIRSHSGQQVALLVDDRLNSGSHHFTWSPADLPPGVYMAVLQTGKTIETKKIIKQ